MNFGFPTSGSQGGSSGTVGGDLAGSLPNPSVVGLQGIPIDSTPPVDGQVLAYSAATGMATWEFDMQQHSGTSALTTVSLSTTSSMVLAASPTRLGFAVKNDGAQTLYLAYAATASTSSYTVDIEPGGTYIDETGYTGAVSGITSTGSSTIRVTELTP